MSTSKNALSDTPIALFITIAREFGYDRHDFSQEYILNIIWGETGFPSFWSEGFGQTTEAIFKNQLRDFFIHGQRCIGCGIPLRYLPDEYKDIESCLLPECPSGGYKVKGKDSILKNLYYAQCNTLIKSNIFLILFGTIPELSTLSQVHQYHDHRDILEKRKLISVNRIRSQGNMYIDMSWTLTDKGKEIVKTKIKHSLAIFYYPLSSIFYVLLISILLFVRVKSIKKFIKICQKYF